MEMKKDNSYKYWISYKGYLVTDTIWWLDVLVVEYYTHYTKKNHTAENDREPINIIEHNIYVFYINLWLTYHHPSCFIIQFNAARPSEQWLKLSVSLSGSCTTNMSFHIIINQSARFGMIAADKYSLEDLFWSHYPFWIMHNFPIKHGAT